MDVSDLKLRNKDVLKGILDKLSEMELDISIMHVCGTHQDTIVKYGLEDAFANVGVKVIQGPGCPVCVTTPREIKAAMDLAESGVTITCFGDMVRVPAFGHSLSDIRAKGGDVQIVYSPEDAVDMARKDPDKDVVFIGIGFETTAPSTAAVIKATPPSNFSVLSMHRLVPPALIALASMGEIRINGIIQPGHVSAIIGTKAYHELLDAKGVPQAVCGFEPLDMAMGVLRIAEQIKSGQPEVANVYTRVVKDEGNPLALKLLDEIFEARDVKWRGFPTIPGSGVGIREAYSAHDAEKVHHEVLLETLGNPDESLDAEPDGCRCGEVLRGLIDSAECPLFGNACSPANPIGPCMVSHEGSCNICYRYRK